MNPNKINNKLFFGIILIGMLLNSCNILSKYSQNHIHKKNTINIGNKIQTTQLFDSTLEALPIKNNNLKTPTNPKTTSSSDTAITLNKDKVANSISSLKNSIYDLQSVLNKYGLSNKSNNIDSLQDKNFKLLDQTNKPQNDEISIFWLLIPLILGLIILIFSKQLFQ